MPYLSDDQEFGRPKSAFRLRLEAMEKGVWIHVLPEEASRATVGRVVNLVSKATGRDFVTRRTPTGVKVWRVA